ncbi:hypothetical protein HKX48_001254 [Thoreauomyces humboldtii]|nr:hypothetical protein HKX48_001254 [Thoreauomyces humboldtii]
MNEVLKGQNTELEITMGGAVLMRTTLSPTLSINTVLDKGAADGRKYGLKLDVDGRLIRVNSTGPYAGRATQNALASPAPPYTATVDRTGLRVVDSAGRLAWLQYSTVTEILAGNCLHEGMALTTADGGYRMVLDPAGRLTLWLPDGQSQTVVKSAAPSPTRPVSASTVLLSCRP